MRHIAALSWVIKADAFRPAVHHRAAVDFVVAAATGDPLDLVTAVGNDMGREYPAGQVAPAADDAIQRIVIGIVVRHARDDADIAGERGGDGLPMGAGLGPQVSPAGDGRGRFPVDSNGLDQGVGDRAARQAVADIGIGAVRRYSRKRGQIYLLSSPISLLGRPGPRVSILRPAIASTCSANRVFPVSCPRLTASWIKVHSSLGMPSSRNAWYF